MNPETGHGLVTDVCLKRKVRNFAANVKNEKPPYELLVKERAILNNQYSRAYEALKLDASKAKRTRGDPLCLTRVRLKYSDGKISRMAIDDGFDDRFTTGTQVTVFTAQCPRHPIVYAVKFHRRKVAYDREVDVYLQLQDLEVCEVCANQVPRLLAYDDAHFAIEMGVVRPHFIVDFGEAYLDRPPNYSEEVWRDWREEKSEAFAENWPAAGENPRDFPNAWDLHRRCEPRIYSIPNHISI